MVIREEHMEATKKAALRAFEDEMVAHLAEFSPPLFNAVKEDQMREAIRFGIARAAEYGIDFRGPVRLYLELMLLFGSHFDSDPQYPWAGAILRDKTSAPQMDRAELLHQKTIDYRKNVAGAEDVYTFQALAKIRELAAQQLPVSPSNFVSDMLAQMAAAYPEKTAYVGEQPLKMLIEKGTMAARHFGFSEVRAVALPIVLMYAFGHGCLNDPLYPWIARTLHDKTITDSNARAKRLEKKAVTWLDHVLANFGVQA